MQFKWLTVGATSLLILQGCATMNEHECVASDWHAIGYEDGSRGYTTDRITKHRKACAKHGIAPDLRTYQAGRHEGLQEYCQPSRGFQLGSHGKQYHGVCSAELEVEFVDAYRAGRRLYELKSNISSINSRFYSRKKELTKTKEKLTAKESRLVSDATPAVERVQLLAETRELAEQKGTLEAQIIELIRNKAVLETKLADYQASLQAY